MKSRQGYFCRLCGHSTGGRPTEETTKVTSIILLIWPVSNFFCTLANMKILIGLRNLPPPPLPRPPPPTTCFTTGETLHETCNVKLSAGESLENRYIMLERHLLEFGCQSCMGTLLTLLCQVKESVDLHTVFFVHLIGITYMIGYIIYP